MNKCNKWPLIKAAGRKGLNLAGLAKEVNMNSASLYRKIRSGDFSVSEIIAIAKVLDLGPKAVYEIFFERMI